MLSYNCWKNIREGFKSVFRKNGFVEIVNAANELDVCAETSLMYNIYECKLVQRELKK